MAVQIYLRYLIQDMDFLKLYKIQLNHRPVKFHLQIVQLPCLEFKGRYNVYILLILIKRNINEKFTNVFEF